MEQYSYNYQVRSYYTYNGHTSYSGWSSVSGTTLPQCPPAQPAQPSLSQPNPDSSTAVSVGWSAISGVLNYSVERSPNNSTGWTAVCTTNVTNCTDNPSPALTRGATYYYRLRANKSTVSGPWSASSSIAIGYSRPGPVPAPTFTGVEPYSYTVNWTGVGDANTGPITYWLAENGSWTNVGSALNRTFSGRSVATDYEYKVQACNGNGLCSTTYPAKIINFPGATGPIGITSIGDFGRSYTLSWAAASGTVTGYELQRFDGQNWPPMPNLDGAPLSEAITNAAAGTTYQYRVRAGNTNASGVFSAVRQYWVPAAPALSASLNASALTLTLSWPALPASHYQLDQSINGAAWQSISTSYAQTSYSMSVVNGNIYSYRVRSCNAEGACSQNAESLNNAVPPGTPASINAIQPAADVRTDVTVSWPGVTGLADGYYLERSTNGGSFTQIAQINGATTLSFNDTGLVSNNVYQYRVRAFKGSLSGAYSPASSNLRIRYLRPTVNMFVSGASQETADVYSAGYNGIYTLNWAAGTGSTATSFNVTELEPAGAWQAASLTALQCAGNQCNYDKPFNNSGADRIYRYRGQACNVDYCSSEREVAVHVKTYPTPGPATNFTYAFTGTPSGGSYSVSWNAPSSTPPNMTGPNAEAVTHYRLARTAPTAAGPWQITHSNTQTAPYTQSFTGGTSGQTYTYEIAACFTPNEAGATTVCSGVSSVSVRVPYAPPNQASGLTHAGLNAQTGSYNLQWTAAGGQVSYYEIERLIGENWVYFATSSSNNHPVAGHPNGERRGYRVRACNVDACGSFTAAHEVYVPHLQPGVPTNLVRQSLDAAARRLTLAWSAPLTGGQVQNYEVEQSSNGGSSWQFAAGTASATLTVNGLTGGTNYLFRVRACNVDACSAFSTQLTAYLPFAAPGAPGAITHNASGINPAQGAFTVNWSAPAAIDSALAPITYYQLEYSVNNGAIWQAAPTGGATPGRIIVSSPAAGASASATLSGLATGAAYSVRARACNADSCGENTAAYQVYLPRPAPAAPVWLPTNPSATDYDARRFTMQWTPPTTGTVNHYQLESYAGISNGFQNWVPVAETPATGYTFIDRAYGQAYRYRVRACSEPQSAAAYCSDWEISADIRLKYPTPNAPGGIAISNLNHSARTFTLNWNGVLGWAPQYRYELQENRNNAGWQALTSVLDPVQQYAVPARTVASYSYRVRACNPAPDTDCSAWSPEAAVTLLPTPNAPGSITANVFEGQTCRFNVSWVPPTNGQGTYHYEFAVQINGGSWSSIAWTTGTTHNMIVGQNNAGLPHFFRVRARTFSNGQYSAWSGWRTTPSSVSTACSTAYNSTGDQLYISAPRYSPTGQYTVNMQSTRNWAPGLQYRNDVRINNVWSSLGAGVAPPGVTSYIYGASNPVATGRYQYRIATCDVDLYPDENPTTCGQTVDFTWDTLATDTTVLRAPGSVGTVRAQGLPNPVEGVHILPNGQFTLDWQTPPVAPGPATQTYEIQYKPNTTTNWMPWAEPSAVDLPVTLPEYGVAYDFRVRACARLDSYVNCGSWSTLNFPVRRSIGAPRFPSDTYPADGELVIYSRDVPLQWLPPLNMAGPGVIDHYEVSLRSRQISDGQEAWFGPELVSLTAAIPGVDNNDARLQQASVMVEQGGLKEFLIRACGSSSSSSCGDALMFQITVIVPADPPEEPAALSGQPHPDSSVGALFNGALTGEFQVQPTGAATYKLPILVPPGTAGMQPNLSLNYSSGAGNGIAGMGWSIDGLSAISRCNKTPLQDGEWRGIDYTDNDAYCLDGQRLIHIGSGQYRTEINNFQRITKMSGGVCGAWFEVKTQAGQTLQYGNSSDSCINAQRNTRTNTAQSVVQGWALNRATDIAGNYMVYKYEETSALGANAFAIDRIEYTGHNSTAPYTAVDFRYETGRPDPVSGYQSGVGTLQTKRLMRITTGVNPADTSEDPSGYGVYTLNYQVDGDRISRLTSIEYCATDASDGSAETLCMEPLEFEWSPWLPGWERLAGYTPPLPFSEYPGKDLGARLVDMDNDGLQDLLYARTGTRSAFRNSGSGWQPWTAFQPPVDFVNADGEDLGVQMADLNGDDRPELLTSVINGSNTYNVYEHNGSAWVLNTSMSLPEAVTAHTTMIRTGARINKPSSDNGLRLADLNGDGLIDLIQGAPNGTTLRAWRNTGSSSGRWEPWPQYAPPVRLAALRSYATTWPVNPPMGWEDEAYDVTGWLADFNGDALPDLLYKNVPHPESGNQETIQYMMRFNTGSGWGPAASAHTTSTVLNVEARGPDAGIRLADLNGDGLPDLMRGNYPDDLVMYNTGTGWVDSPFEKVAEVQTFFAPISIDYHNRLLADLNHDGRTDVLLPGNSWLSSEDAGDGWKESLDYAAPVNIANYPGVARVVDINGDGRTDLLNSIANSNQNGAWTQRSGPRRITAVNDGLGNTTGVKYKALTDRSLDGRSRAIYSRTTSTLAYPYEHEVNTPMPVVDRVTVDDGIGGELVTEYAYRGLTAVIGGRGLQGFESVTAYKPDGTVVTSRFGQRFPYAGLPLEMRVTYGEGAGAPLISSTTHDYCFAVTSAANAGAAANPETATFTSASGTCGAYDDRARNNEAVFIFDRRTTTIKSQLSNNLQSTTATTTTITETTFGAFGNRSSALSTTTGDGHTYTGEVSHVYDTSQPDWRWMGRVQETTSIRRVDGAADGNSTRKTRYEYYTNGFLKKEIAEPDAQAPLKAVKAHAYDQYGNTTQTTSCASDFSYCEAGAVNPNAASPGSEEFRTTTTNFDSRGRYPLNQTNALNHIERYVHNHPLGLRTQLTGANGLVTNWRYDSLGQKVSETTVFGTTTFEYRRTGGGYVPGASYFKQENSPVAAPARIYYDSKGRERRALTQNLHGEWVASDTEYDHFGRVRRSSRPYFVYGTMSGDVHWMETDYDILGRVVRSRVPLGDIDGDGADNGVALSSSDYQGLQTIATDTMGRRKLTEQNALGQTVRVVDDLDGEAVAIEYTYDSQGSLTTTTVDNNPATTIIAEFDRRGNNTAVTDPDLGRWDYRYNGFGELVWQRDAKMQVAEIDYDALGRMTQRREWPDENNDGVLEAVQTSYFTYDTAPGAGIGKLHSESGAAGDTKVYSYTARGQLDSTEYQFNINGWSQNFLVSQTYDALGRAQLIRYPQAGGERLTVENRYSPFGGLWYVLDAGDPLSAGDESVYWIADIVDVRGRVTQETLRNRNTINNTINSATGWLQKVESWDKDLNMIQQVRYAFDEVGNVQSRERFRPWILNPDGSFYAGSNEQVIESFDYDSLDRLLTSTVTRDGTVESIKSNGYDRLGNFDYKDSTANTYSYSGCNGGLHAVCSAGGTTFTYDANGNMIESAGTKERIVEYDAANKPTQITDGGATVYFTYGADRARVFKQSFGNDGRIEVTWYVGLGAEGQPLYEQNAVVEDGQIVSREHLHFIYAGDHHGGQAFAVRVQEEVEDNNPSLPNPVRYAGSEYYHRDHLGSVIAITGDTGSVEETRLLSFDSWGKRRNANWSEGGSEPVNQYTREGMRGNLAYTGHEAIPEVGLIHMNGRVYDPELGIFLSADTYVQFGNDHRSYNRYSYVQNNPLRYTDPSGHFLGIVTGLAALYIGHQAMKQMPAGLASFISMALNFVPYCQYWCSALFNAHYAYANGADFGDALATGAVSFFASGIGGSIGGGGGFGDVAGGLVSGAISGGFGAAMSGGDFFDGALKGAARGAAMAAVLLAISEISEAMQPQYVLDEVGADGSAPAAPEMVEGDIKDIIQKYFEGDPQYKDLFKSDAVGNLIFSAKLEAFENNTETIKLRQDMIDDVNKTYDHIVVGGGTFTVKLSAHDGVGKPDFVIMNRNQLKREFPQYFKNDYDGFSRSGAAKFTCHTACSVPNSNVIGVNGTTHAGKYLHEFFHKLGWARGNNHIPDRTDLMHKAFEMGWGKNGHGLKHHHYWGLRDFYIGR